MKLNENPCIPPAKPLVFGHFRSFMTSIVTIPPPKPLVFSHSEFLTPF